MDDACLGNGFDTSQVTWDPGRPSRYGFDELQSLIAWSFQWKFSDDYIKASQKFIEFNEALSQYELISCTFRGVPFSNSEQVQWEIAWSLCDGFSVLENILMRFRCESSSAVIWCTFFQGLEEFSVNIYLEIMAQCSYFELWIIAWRIFSVSVVSVDTSMGDRTGIYFTSKLTGADARLQNAMVAMEELNLRTSWIFCSVVVAFSQNLHDSVRCNKTVNSTHVSASYSMVDCCRVLISVIFTHIASLLKLTPPIGSPIYMQVHVQELGIDGFLQERGPISHDDDCIDFLKVLQVPWDPGRFTWFRLEGKPNLWRGDCQRPGPRWALSHYPAHRRDKDYIYKGRQLRPTGLGPDGGFGRGLTLA